MKKKNELINSEPANNFLSAAFNELKPDMSNTKQVGFTVFSVDKDNTVHGKQYKFFKNGSCHTKKISKIF